MIKRKTAMEFGMINHLFTEKEESFLHDLIRDEAFLERILLNSESLYNKLEKIINYDKEIDKKTKKTLRKYLLRMAARPQPNRLNSGICLEQAALFHEKKQMKKVEISLEWEQKLIKKLESLSLPSSAIKLVLNPTLYKKETQYILEKSMRDCTSYVYFKNSDFLDMLFHALKKPMSLQCILDQYSDNSNKDLLLNVIQDLIRAEIIKTELSSYSINRNTDAFIERVKQNYSHNDGLVNQLEEIQCTLERYRNAEIGKGINVYRELINQMSYVCKSSSYLIVDLYMYDSMEEKVKVIDHENINETLQMMNFFDKSQRFDWKGYYNSFLSKYGFYTKVPLLQMIDRDEGIGLPQDLQINEKNIKINQYVMNRMMQCHVNREEKLTLTSTDYQKMQEIYEREEENRIPISYDCKIVPYGEQLLLPPNSFSFPAQSFTGRFSLPEKEEPKEKSKYSEINYVSNYFKDIGLTHKSNSNTFIDCVGQTNYSLDRIPLRDIHVLVQDGRFHLIYRNEILYPVSTHLLTYRNFNEHPALIFLSEFNRYYFEYPSNFPTDHFSYLEFIPRVEYKNFILSPARINITFEEGSKKEERITKIKERIKKYHFNQFKYVYILEADRTLPVPADTDLSLDFLESCKQKVGEEYKLTLMEAPDLEDVKKEVSDWIYSSSNERNERSALRSHHLQKTIEVSSDIADKLDPSVYSYFLYYRSGKREKVEGAILKLKEQLQLEGVFIVNFIDEKNKEHIRLRFNKRDKKDLELEKELAAMHLSGDLYEYKKTLFYPEINRYGGKDMYALAYSFFAVDTSLIETFKAHYANYNDTGKALYLSSYTLLGLLGNDIDLLYDYLEMSIKKESKYVKSFSKQRNEYRKIVLKSLQDFEKATHPIFEKYRRVSSDILDAAKKIKLSKEELYYLVRSIIHMSMNRHFPFKRELEEEANQFMRFAFSNISYQLRGIG